MLAITSIGAGSACPRMFNSIFQVQPNPCSVLINSNRVDRKIECVVAESQQTKHGTITPSLTPDKGRVFPPFVLISQRRNFKAPGPAWDQEQRPHGPTVSDKRVYKEELSCVDLQTYSQGLHGSWTLIQ